MRAPLAASLCVLASGCGAASAPESAPVAARATAAAPAASVPSCDGKPFFECLAGVAAGASRTCAWTREGDGLCWGGHFGPREETAFKDVVSMIADVGLVCALDRRGRVECAGYRFDVFANPSRPRVSAGPFEVDGLEPSRLTFGRRGLCVLGTDAEGKELLLGTVSDRADPRQVDRLDAGDVDCDELPRPDLASAERRLSASPHEPVVATAEGLQHACVLDAKGGVACWGRNDRGQLGDGTLDAREEPLRVQGLPPIVAIAAGHHHTCGLSAVGTLSCWGSNARGELRADQPLEPTRATSIGPSIGPEDQVRHELGYCIAGERGGACTDLLHGAPQPIAGAAKAMFIAASQQGQAWIDADGTARGRVVNGAPTIGVPSTIEIVKGWNETWALSRDGRVTAWGDARFGFEEAGGATVKRQTDAPHRFAFKGIARIASGLGCALSQEGMALRLELKCEEPLCGPTLAPVPGLSGVIDVAGTDGSCFAVQKDGALFALSAREAAAAERIKRVARPKRVHGVSDVVRVDADHETLCALTRDGRAYCGDPLDAARGLSRVKGAEGLTSIAVVRGGACGTRADQSVACWEMIEGSPRGTPHDPAAGVFARPIRIGTK